MKLGGKQHQAARLAIAFRKGHRVACLCNEHHGISIKKRHASDDRRIVAVSPVTMQFDKTRKQPLDIITRSWAVGVPCERHHTDWIQWRLRSGYPRVLYFRKLIGPARL